MKQLLIFNIFICVLLTFGCNSQNFDKLIVGDWKVYKMEFNNSQLNNKGERNIVETTWGWIFTNKNVCINKYLIPKGDKVSTGTYRIEDSVLIIFNNNKTKILTLNKNELTFEGDFNQIWYCLRTEFYNSLSENEKNDLLRYTYYDSLYINKIKFMKELDIRINKTKDIYEKVPIMPSYPNGEKGIDEILNKYYKNVFLMSNEVSPVGVEYDYVQFVVESDGSISYPAINLKNNKEYDFFKNVFQKMGKWIPGKIDGKNVAVKMELLFRRK